MARDNKKQPKTEDTPAPEPAAPEASQEPESLEAPASVEDNGTSVSGSTNQAEAPKASVKRSPIRKFTESKFLYIWIFIIVIVCLSVLIYVMIGWSKTGPSAPTKTKSLTNAELASLASNTTVVGDAQQTLSVQSNAIFQGSVLLKQGLDVAGGIKVGGALSLPTITVGGTGNFGQLQVNSTLSVAGNTVIQGQLNVQKNLVVSGSLSISSLSAAQISVTTLQINGDLLVSKHFVTGGGNPGRSTGGALGVGGTASVSGSDTSGSVNISTGGGPIAAGCFVTVNFVQKFGSTPHVVISPTSSDAAGISYYTNISSSGFSICDADAPGASANYNFDYFVSG